MGDGTLFHLEIYQELFATLENHILPLAQWMQTASGLGRRSEPGIHLQRLQPQQFHVTSI